MRWTVPSAKDPNIIDRGDSQTGSIREEGSLAHRQSLQAEELGDRVGARQSQSRGWGIDGESIEAFGEGLEERLARLHEELRTDKYVPDRCGSSASQRRANQESGAY